MRKFKVFLFIGIMTFYISCKNENNEKQKWVKLPDGYILVNYYIKNNDTVLNGNYFKYDKQNKLIRTGKFINGEPFGNYKKYFPNGKVESIRFIKNKKDIGETTWFYTNGNIEQYIFYDDFRNATFIAKYDKGDGYIILEIYQHKLRNQGKQITYKIGDKIRYQYMFPNIPHAERKFRIELKDYDNSKLKRVIKHIAPVTLDIEEKAVKKGKNTIMAYIEYKIKEKDNLKIKDSVWFDFYVK
jgi:hypothetical protein